MILPRLAWRSLLNRRFTVLLAVLTIAISVFLLLAVDKLRSDARRSFFNTISGVDLIVGARSGAVQLLLYSVFHIGDASNSIRWSSVEFLRAQRGVKWLVPLSLGDSHRGFRVVGTSAEFFVHYRYGERRTAPAFQQGVSFSATFEAVVGSEVAASLGYQPGQPIVLSHDALHQHEQSPLRIVGVLAPTGTPVDRSVLVPLAAISALHAGWERGVPLPGSRGLPPPADESPPTSVSAVLLGLDSPVAALGLQRQINEWSGEPLLAILPGMSLQQLWSLTSVAENALLIIAGCVVAAGLLGMLAILLATLEQRRREMALLRSVGAGPLTIFGLLLLECLLLVLAGIGVGLLLLALATHFAGDWLAAQHGLQLSDTLLSPWGLRMLLMVAGSGLLLGLLPAWSAYRRSLADGLSMRL